MLRRLAALLGCLLVAWSGLVAAQSDARPDRIVYHFNEGTDQASRGLEYIRNHLEVNPQAKITVVAHAGGVDFLLRDAKSRLGNAYRQAIEDLDLQGVVFKVCEITLRERGLQRSQFAKEATFVRSGVDEVGRLQQREGHAYIRP